MADCHCLTSSYYVQPLDVYIARSVDWLTAIGGPPVDYVQPLDVYIARSVDWLTAIGGPPVTMSSHWMYI